MPPQTPQSVPEAGLPQGGTLLTQVTLHSTWSSPCPAAGKLTSKAGTLPWCSWGLATE